MPKEGKHKPRYGGLGIRILAYLVDKLVLIALLLAVYFGGTGIMSLIKASSLPAALQLPITLLWFFVFLLCVAAYVGLYFVWFEGRKKTTIGKALFGLIVVKEGNAPIGLKASLVRLLGRFACELTLGLGYLIILFTDERQGLHDMIAGTRVVYADSVGKKKPELKGLL